MVNAVKLIKVEPEIIDYLKSERLTERESYNEVLKRLLKPLTSYIEKNNLKVSVEERGLIELWDNPIDEVYNDL